MVPGWLRKHVAQTVILIVGILAMVGLIRFALAVRPCRMEVKTGTEVVFRLTTEVLPVEGGAQAIPLLQQEQQVVLYGLDDHELVVIAPRPDGSDELTRVQWTEDGRMRRAVSNHRQPRPGLAFGLCRLFDLSLLALPDGGGQDWKLTIDHAGLPERQRQVACRVRRLASGLQSRFELKSEKTIEWVDETPPSGFVQVKDLICRYTYNGRVGLVDQAELTCVLGRGRQDAIERQRVRMVLSGQCRIGEPVDRQLVLAIERSQERLAGGKLADQATDLGLLRTAQGSGRLPLLARRLAEELQPSEGIRAGWMLQVASVRRSEDAGRMADRLRQEGYPVTVLTTSNGWQRVCVGPYRTQDDRVRQTLRQCFPDAQWIRSGS